MFKLITLEDEVQVPPNLFSYSKLAALEFIINKRLSDRVIPGIGLCIALWDWISVGDDRILWQTGETSTCCQFRVVVFAPFEGETVFGRISGSHSEGLCMEVGFFDAIHIPTAALPVPSTWDKGENVWIWAPKFDEEDETQEQEQKLYMDVTNESVFRVMGIDYRQNWKTPPSERQKNKDSAVMTIRASLFDKVTQDNQGLGDPRWWQEEDVAEEDAENQDYMEEDNG